jgi:hypothetical protein
MTRVASFAASCVCIAVLGACVAEAAAAKTAPSPWASGTVKPLASVDDFIAMMRSPDEVSAVFVYDSADVNSLRTAPQYISAVDKLNGFARFYALDIRTEVLDWVLDAWNVQTLPTIRVLGFDRGTRSGWGGTPLAGVGGQRPVSEVPVEGGVQEANLKRTVLAVQGAVPISRIETDAKARLLHGQVSSGGKASVVLVSNKPTSSQLFKAVAISFNRRCDFYDVNAEKAPAARELFGAKKLPQLVLYDHSGKRHEFTGELTHAAITAFIEPHVADRATAQRKEWERDALTVEREAKRGDTPVLRVSSQAEWDADVSERQSITGVFFLDDASKADALNAAVRDLQARSGARSAVGQFVWVLRADAPALANALTRQEGEEPATAAFVSAKKKIFSRYAGAATGSNLQDFIAGPLSRGIGSKSFDSLPPFGQA